MAPPAASVASSPPNRNALIAGGVLAAAALLVVVLVVTSGGDDGGGDATATTVPATSVSTVAPGTTGEVTTTSSLPEGTLDPTTLQAGEVLLEPVNAPMADPFTPTAGAAPEAPPTVSLPEIPLPTTTAPLAEGQVPLAQVAGREPGLYGGTRDVAACDAQTMIGFLEANPDKAGAWAMAQGISATDIRTYVEGLTPVTLTRDTRVTNHGFRNGQAYAHPSVLQAGHAVLVDRFGVPRAKCSCGNPLLPPEPVSGTTTYVGPQWPGFTVVNVVVVIATDPVDEGFVIIDTTTGVLIVRPVGAAPGTPDLGTGDVRVTLRWSSVADLDLSASGPDGLYGAWDLDANAACSTAEAAPTENVVWSDNAPDGLYEVRVNLWSDCGEGDTAIPFQVTAFVGGSPVQMYLGTDDGGLSPSDGYGSVSTSVPTVIYVFERGGTPGAPPTGVPGGSTDTAAVASQQILDQLLFDCGVGGTFTDAGSVEGGWRWFVDTDYGQLDYTVFDPTANWSVASNSQISAEIAVNCGFYSP
jgi:hypothetical protein